MTFDAATFLLAVTNTVALILSAFGALVVAFGGAKAIRRVFWAEAEPWQGPAIPRLESIRMAFGHRILLGLEFFIAGDVIRLLIDPALLDLARIGLLVLIRVVLSFVITREIRLPAVAPRPAPARRGR